MTKKIIALFITVCTVLTLFAACSSKKNKSAVDLTEMTETERAAYITENLVGSGKVLTESDVELVSEDEGYANSTQEMAKILENDNFDVFIDFESTAIAVYDKRDEAELTYHSDPHRYTGTGSDVQLSLIAYDSTNKRYEFDTSENCVKDPTYYMIVQTGENSIRIIYTIGNDPDKELVPPVLTAETFDSIVETLTKRCEEEGVAEFGLLVQDVENLYKQLNPDELSLEDKEAYQEYYPTVTVRTLYVAREMTQKQKKLIKSAMESAGFTVDDLKKELTTVEYAGPARAVLFTVPVDITLNDDGITASVNTKDILASSNQTINKISLWQGFGAVSGTADKREYFILPDGSGTVMKLSSSYALSTYREKVYGTDLTLQETTLVEKTEQILSGFYIFDRDGLGGFMSVVEGGAGHISLRASPSSSSSIAENALATANYELICNEMDYRNYKSESGTVEETDKKTTAETVGSGVVTAKSGNPIDFRIRYIFNRVDEELSASHTYSEYAAIYRDYLLSVGKMQDVRVDETVTPFYVDLWGAIDKNVSVAGFPVERKIALTTYSQAKEIVGKLFESGITPNAVQLKYSNWANGGYYSTVNNSVDLVGELGSKKELSELISYLNENGAGFYPTAEFTLVYRDGGTDAFNYSKDAARKLTLRTAKVYDRNIATGMLNSESAERTVISPDVIKDFASDYRKSFEKTVGTKSIALASIGEYVNSNYKTNRVVTKVDTTGYYDETLSLYSDYKVMVDVGNDYTWKYADHILEIPEGSSEYLCMATSIPFIQMVLHGYINYAGNAFNLDSDYSTSVLKAVETGGGVYFRWIYADNIVFDNTDFTGVYSMHYEDTLSDALSAYAKVSKVVDLVMGQQIINHEEAMAYVESAYIGDIGDNYNRIETENVFMTTFENGVQTVVNYNNYNVELDDEARTVVQAGSYVYREGDGYEWSE